MPIEFNAYFSSSFSRRSRFIVLYAIDHVFFLRRNNDQSPGPDVRAFKGRFEVGVRTAAGRATEYHMNFKFISYKIGIGNYYGRSYNLFIRIFIGLSSTRFTRHWFPEESINISIS